MKLLKTFPKLGRNSCQYNQEFQSFRDMRDMTKTLVTLTCLAKPQGAVFPQRPPGPARRPPLRCWLLQSGSRVTGFRWLQQSPSDLVEAGTDHVRRSWGPGVEAKGSSSLALKGFALIPQIIKPLVKIPTSSFRKMWGNAHVRHDASHMHQPRW